MIKILLFSIFVLPINFAKASALVCKKGDTIEVTAELKFYGSESKMGPACAEEIYKMYNEPSGKIKIGNKEYKVKFKISHQIITEKEAFGSASINSRVQNNYIRTEKKAANEKDGRSNNQIGQNCGFYASDDSLGKSTTCAHEFAHGLGLVHYNQRPIADRKMDLLGTGQPGIMAARGFLVDPQFQYKSNAKPGAKNGTINPVLRKVLWSDIEDLKLDRLEYDDSGCSALGRATNTTYAGDGTSEWQGWRAPLEGLKYLMSGKVGNPPIACEKR